MDQQKPRFTLKEIKKRHAKNPQDKKWHEIIENGSIDEKEFEELLIKAVNSPPFDKEKTRGHWHENENLVDS